MAAGYHISCLSGSRVAGTESVQLTLVVCTTFVHLYTKYEVQIAKHKGETAKWQVLNEKYEIDLVPCTMQFVLGGNCASLNEGSVICCNLVLGHCYLVSD